MFTTISDKNNLHNVKFEVARRHSNNDDGFTISQMFEDAINEIGYWINQRGWSENEAIGRYCAGL